MRADTFVLMNYILAAVVPSSSSVKASSHGTPVLDDANFDESVSLLHFSDHGRGYDFLLPIYYYLLSNVLVVAASIVLLVPGNNISRTYTNGVSCIIPAVVLYNDLESRLCRRVIGFSAFNEA